MDAIFKDPSLQATFLEQGYVVVDLLQPKDIERLNALFASHIDQYGQPFHTSHFSPDKTYKQQVHDTVASVVAPKVAEWVNNYVPVFGNFMIKQPNPDGFLQVHADWTYVDESKHRSIAVWLPMVDTNLENGCLGVLPGTHKVVNAIRGPGIRQTTYLAEKEWEQQLGVLLPIKAGQAVIYDHGLVHYSLANKSNVARPALNLSLVPVGVPMIHYCKPEEATEIEIYKVDDPSFFIKYDHFKRPETASLIGTMPIASVKYFDEAIAKMLPPKEEHVEEPKPEKKKGLLARIFGI